MESVIITFIVIVGVVSLALIAAVIWGIRTLWRKAAAFPENKLAKRLDALDLKEQVLLTRVDRSDPQTRALIQVIEDKRFIAMRAPSLQTVYEYSQSVDSLARRPMKELPPASSLYM